MGSSPTLNQLAARLAAHSPSPPAPEPPPFPLDMPLNPLDLSATLARLKAGDTLTLEQGVYQLPRQLVILGTGDGEVAIQAAEGARVVVTCMNGVSPSLLIADQTRVKGLWFGGAYDTTDNPIQMGSYAVVEGCTFSGYRQCIIEGTGHHNQYLNNRFIRCGKPGLQHAIYIAGDDVGVSKYALIEGNVFVGCDSYALHLWHMPANVTIRRNFLARCRWLLVDQGAGHVITDNIFWSHLDAIINPSGSSTTFTHNLMGYDTRMFSRWANGANKSGNLWLHGLTHPQDSAPVLLFPSAVKDVLGVTHRQVETALDAIEKAFRQPVDMLFIDGRVDAPLAFLDALTQWA